MTSFDLLASVAGGGAATLLAALGLSFVPRVRLATRRALLVAGTAAAAAAPLVALLASALGLGMRAPGVPATADVAARAPADVSLPRARASALAVAPPVGESAPRTDASAPASVSPSSAAPAAPWWTWVVLAWAAGTALGLLSIAIGLVRVARLRRSLAPSEDARATDAFVAHDLAVPATIGVLRPVVALPAGFSSGLSDEDLDAVLRHERSHAERRDPLAGLLARVARAVHWPDPLAHLAARRLDALSESLADAAAVGSVPAAAPRYAACLLRVAETAVAAPRSAGVHPIVGRRRALAARVEALLDPKTVPDATPSRLGPALAAGLALAASAAVALAVPGPPVAAADDGASSPAPEKRAGLAYAGRVVDPDGNPVEGAVVWADGGSSFQVMLDQGLVPWRHLAPDALAAAETWNAVRATRSTGADGRFVVEGVGPAAGGSVRAVHPRWASGVVAVSPTAATKDGRVEVGDVVLRRGVSFSVCILDAQGKPIPGAWLAAQPEDRESRIDRIWPWSLGRAPGHARVARAGDDGIATIEGLEEGVRYAVAAFTEKHPPRVGSFTKTPSESWSTGTDPWGLGRWPKGGLGPTVRLAEGMAVRILVVDRATGAPRPGCRIDLSVPEEGSVVSFPRPGPVARGTTDASGAAEFVGLEDRELDVTVVPADQASNGGSDPPPFSVRKRVKPGSDPARFALDPVRSVRVEPFDAAAGSPVEGARLLFSPVWQGYDSSGGFPSDVSLSPPRREAGLRPGRWTLRAYASGYRPAAVAAFDVAVQGDPPVVRIPFEKAQASAFGRVLTKRTGAPVAGATVRSYEWIEWLLDGPKAEATTDADGRFRFDGLIGQGVSLRLDVSAPGFLPAVLTRDDREHEDLGDLALTAASTVTGVYVNRTKAPIPHATVALWRGDGQSGLKSDFAATATTDEQGRFRIDGLAAGRYTLVPAGGERTPLTIDEGVAVDVTLEGGGN